MIQQLQTKKTSTHQKQLPKIEWEILPKKFILPDDPVESILHPLLADALTEALQIAGLVTSKMLIASNIALTLRLDGITTVQVPDWFLVLEASLAGKGVIRRSYTPHKEGEIPAVVMEFLSETDQGEYSIRPRVPFGKMWFYEKIIKVPIYVIFDPELGRLEIRRLNSEGNYELESLDQNNRYFINTLGLYLGIWSGERLGEDTYWLRWWDSQGNLLLWGNEKIALEKQRADLAELEIAKLKQLLAERGIEIPESN
ncbi:MAG TPA: Uma2 family endonuclease [Allocoleopsis sp.]